MKFYQSPHWKVPKFILEHKNSVDALAIHPLKKGFFATGAHDRTIKLWDVNKEKSNATFSADE